MMFSPLRALLLASTALAAGATPALAQVPQQPVPPANYSLDTRGVDLVSGQLTYKASEVTIGVPGDGGITHGRVYLSSPSGGGWRDTLAGTINASGSLYTVSVGGASQVFLKTGSSFGPVVPSGYTLSQSGSTYTFTTPSGAVANFSTNWVAYISPYQANVAVVTDYSVPSGEKLTYTYQGANVCSRFGDDGQCEQHRAVARLQSIGNNRGYLLHYDYSDDDPEAGFGWAQLQTVTGLNLAVDYCAPGADDCTYSQTWPSVTYDSFIPTTATDEQSFQTTYGYVVGGLGSVRYPSATADNISITYDVAGRVASVSNHTGSWNYTYSDLGSTRTTTAAGPNSQVTTVVSNQTTQKATSISNAAGSTWSFQYDPQTRLTRVTQPEGNYAEYTYGAFGNLEKTTYVDKTGSLTTKIEMSATFPTSCSTLLLLCHRPLTTTDGNGNTTSYTWDPDHGSILSVTSPIPAGSEPQPSSRYTYTSLYAWYKNAAGALVQAPTPVVRLIEMSTCATGTSCIGTADEVRATIAYGSTGTANNLLPTGVSNGAGNGSLVATSTFTYTGAGDVATRDGPLTGNSDLTQYHYDAGRRLVGIVGPDPDGAGGLLNRAQKFTYSPRGLVTLTEVGTAPGYTPSDWLSFAALQRRQTDYDNMGRATREDYQSSAGTAYQVTQWSYDTAGRAECVATRMNPNVFGSLPTSACSSSTQGGFGPDRIVKYTYDNVGRVGTISSGFGTASVQAQTTTYTANGRQQTFTDAMGNTSTYEYDDFDRFTKLRYPSLTTPGTSSTSDFELYSYDNNGNATSYTNRASQTFGFTFDRLNRGRVINAPGSTPDTAFTYDNLGRATSVSDNVTGGANIPMTWDALGRLITSGGALGTMTMQYDLASRRTRVTWPDTTFVTYEYDSLDQMTAIKKAGTTTLAAYSYDNLGRRTGIARANGVSTAYDYDPISRLLSLSHDFPGTTVSDVTWTYTYNPGGQAISQVLSSDTYAYSGRSAGTVTYTNDRLNRLTGLDATTITYDANSNVLSDGTRIYTYDAANRLLSVNGTSTLSYDPMGRLSSMVGTTGASYIYDGMNLAGGAVTGTAINFRLVTGPWPDELVAALQGVGTTTATVWSLNDRLMSVSALADNAGAALFTNAYDEYGRPRAANAGRLMYTGQLLLPDFGAYSYKTRNYHPELGRFLQPDPISYSAGQNLYAYVGNDPVNQTDPSGLCPPCIVIAAGAGFGALTEIGVQVFRAGRITDGGRVWRAAGYGAAAAGLGIWAGAPVAAALAQTVLRPAASAAGGVVGGAVSGFAQEYALWTDMAVSSGQYIGPPPAQDIASATLFGALGGGGAGFFRGTRGLPAAGTRVGPYHLYPYHRDAAHNVLVGELVSNAPPILTGSAFAGEVDPYIYVGHNRYTLEPVMCRVPPPTSPEFCRPAEPPTSPPIPDDDTEGG